MEGLRGLYTSPWPTVGKYQASGSSPGLSDSRAHNPTITLFYNVIFMLALFSSPPKSACNHRANKLILTKNVSDG